MPGELWISRSQGGGREGAWIHLRFAEWDFNGVWRRMFAVGFLLPLRVTNRRFDSVRELEHDITIAVPQYFPFAFGCLDDEHVAREQPEPAAAQPPSSKDLRH